MVKSINCNSSERSGRNVPGNLPAVLGLAFLAIAGAESATAQVNTEAMRGTDATPGLHTSLEARYTWVSGNTEFVKTNGMARLDYRKEDYHGFLVGNYEFGRQGGETFIQNGFAHYRNVLGLSRRIASEVFAQMEFNDFLMLQQRRLLGAGFRYSLGGAPNGSIRGAKADLGLGLMQEHEEIDGEAPDGTTVFRATSYANLRFDLGNRVTANAVAYYQPRLAVISDYRILGQAGLGIDLSRNLSLQTAIKGRYDSRPPGILDPFDIEAVNGLKLAF